jgi:hypothetical protein
MHGHKKDYVEEIKKVSLERLARLIRVCGFLMQTKVYLFWKSSQRKMSKTFSLKHYQ